MNKKQLSILFSTVGLLTAFAVWTAALGYVDVRPVGPEGSEVGFAAMNRAVHDLTGVHMELYVITDWLGLVPVGFVIGFGLLGLLQWVSGKHICKVDFSILVLGGFYIAVFAAYVFFEKFVVNYRPVLIGGVLEASYPSSTTMLALCVMPTTALQLNRRIKNRLIRRFVLASMIGFTAFMVVGRILSGVHWISDIIGGILLSGGLVMLYVFICGLEKGRSAVRG